MSRVTRRRARDDSNVRSRARPRDVARPERKRFPFCGSTSSENGRVLSLLLGAPVVSYRSWSYERRQHMFHRECIPFDVRNAWKHNRLVIDESRPKQSLLLLSRLINQTIPDICNEKWNSP